MRCPRCGSSDDRVVDSRTVKDGTATRRRRECNDCGFRFTTYEYVETSYPVVVKMDGRREPFDRRKLEQGIARACEKRPVSAEDMQGIVDGVVSMITEQFTDEVTSRFIGESVMELLQDVDQVAFVRFASVYRQFKDVSQFKEELDNLLSQQ
ncbi:transcriptional repressor NrdR [Candidatus Fermentibacterales bacterium]|nr:transcriptional repressor NrdR [Candidatus Fermentibacterales bacterium]